MTLRSLIAGSIISSALTLPILAQQDSNPAQQQPPPAQSTSSQNPPKKDQPKKSAAQENPFPEAQSESAAHQQTGSEPSAPQPQNPQTTPQSPSQNKNGDQNPFPEEQSEKAAHTAQEPDSPKSSSPSSGDENYSSSRVKGLDMPTPDDSVAAPAPTVATSLPYNPKLARKDAEIGDFYMESGNFKGAYERFQEANRSDPGNAEAVYGLGESARHLDRRDEALRNYRLYLAALPNGPHAKEIRKAMKEMGAEPAS
jgi:tetratricopeptide (TPR) repeat protein